MRQACRVVRGRRVGGLAQNTVASSVAVGNGRLYFIDGQDLYIIRE